MASSHLIKYYGVTRLLMDFFSFSNAYTCRETAAFCCLQGDAASFHGLTLASLTTQPPQVTLPGEHVMGKDEVRLLDPDVHIPASFDLLSSSLWPLVCWDTWGAKLAESEWKYSLGWATCVSSDWASLHHAGLVAFQPVLETAAVRGHIRPFLILLLFHFTFDQTRLD